MMITFPFMKIDYRESSLNIVLFFTVLFIYYFFFVFGDKNFSFLLGNMSKTQNQAKGAKYLISLNLEQENKEKKP